MRYILLLSIFLMGCSFNPDRKQVLADPRTPDDIKGLIYAKRIRVGMTKQQVTAAWGKHCWYCYGTKTSSWGDTWEYNQFGTGRHGIGNGRYLYFDKAGRLEAISQ